VSPREGTSGMLDKLHGESLYLVALVDDSWVMFAKRSGRCTDVYTGRTKEDVLSNRISDQPTRCYVRHINEGLCDLAMW
jgi:hypothetical protein